MTQLGYKRRPRSPIEQDAEFIVMAADTMILSEIIAECGVSFDQPPSKSAIHRFLQRSRRLREQPRLSL